MPNTRLIGVNGSGGPFTAILATIFSRRVRIREDEAAASTGLQYQMQDDGFTRTQTVGTVGTPSTDDAPQIDLGNRAISHPKPILGGPAQGVSGAFNFIPATTLVKVQGKAAGATTIRVHEDD
jgi:hypothetical protein